MVKNVFFVENRARLMAECDGVVVLTAHTALQSRGDMAAPFQQEANFWYLTGIEKPDWQLVITKEKSWLISPLVSDTHRVFDGELSHEQARRVSGVDEVIGQEGLDELLSQLSKKHKKAGGLGSDPYQKYYDFTVNPAPQKLWRQLQRQFTEVVDVRRSLTRLRAIKQPVEIELITRAVALTVDAFSEVRRQLPEFDYEYEVEAEFTHAFRRVNAMHAYDPIVASGSRACTLHYTDNNGRLEQSQLLLLDIGARVEGYPADITRTYAVGDMTKRQSAVHEAVRRAHHEIVAQLTPGLSFVTYHEQVDRIMKRALDSLGILKAETDYRRYFPHAIGHGLGLDVHDSLRGYDEFMPGMIVTVEPGIYIPDERIGVRLEDDILISGSGHKNLSGSLPLSL